MLQLKKKKAYIKFKLKDLSHKGRWSTLKTIMGLNKGINDMDLWNKWNVHEINEFFLNAVLILTHHDIKHFYEHDIKKSVHTTLTFQPVSEIDILNIITGIKSKAVGPDGINILTLNLYIPFLLPYITHIINSCLLNSVSSILEEIICYSLA